MRAVPAESDEALEAFCGSRARLLTLGVLASAEAPLSGYRVAEVAGLPRAKVYPELSKAVVVGVVERGELGYSLVDPELRALLRARIRVTWDLYLDQPDPSSSEAVRRELARIRRTRKRVSVFDPRNRIPAGAIRELTRDPEKNRALRRIGLKPSERKG